MRVGSPATLGEDATVQNTADIAYQQLANVVILVSLPIRAARWPQAWWPGWPTASARPVGLTSYARRAR